MTSDQKPLNFFALDLELNQPSRRIIQVGICIGNLAQPAQAYLRREWLLSPGEPIAPDIVALCGITDTDIAARAVTHETLAAELSALLVAHACFVNPVTWGGNDAEELLTELRARDIHFPHFGHRCIDAKTYHVMRQLAQGRSASGGLKSVMGGYKLPFEGTAHRADVDAYNTLRLFFHFLRRQAAIEGLCAAAKALG